MRISKLRVIGAATLSIATLASGAAFAEGSAQQREACTPDVFRLCGMYIPNVNHIVACLQGNESRLSPACHQAMFEQPQARANEARMTRLQPANY